MTAILNQIGLWPLLGTALPLLVALFTTRKTHPGIQGALFALLATFGGIAEQYVRATENHAAYDWKAALLSAVGAWVVGQVAHTGLWKATGLSAALQRVGTTARAVEKELPASAVSALRADIVAFLDAASARINANAAAVDASAQAVAQAATVVATQGVVKAPEEPVGELAVPDATDDTLEAPADDDADLVAP